MFLYTLISFTICWISLSSQLIELTPKIISSFDKNKQILALVYYSSKDTLLLKAIENLQREYSNYNFGYVDTTISENILSFFKISNMNSTGFVIYNFKNHEYYVEEHVSSIKEVKDLLEQANNNTLNWSSQSIIETIGWYITRKRLGKKAHQLFTFILCLFAIAVFTITNIYTKRMERKEIEKKLHTN